MFQYSNANAALIHKHENDVSTSVIELFMSVTSRSFQWQPPRGQHAF